MARWVGQPSPTGTLERVTLRGAASGVTLRVWVWLPPAYSQPAYARSRFPVLVAFPGGSGAGYNTWTSGRYGAQRLISSSSARARVSPFILVMPEMQVSAGLDTECTDLAGAPKVGTWLARDLPPLVRGSFRTIENRQGWGLIGASSGAYCAAALLYQHPEQYQAAVSIAGYYQPDTSLPGVHDPRVEQSSPQWIASHRPPPGISLLLITSKGWDHYLALRFLQQLPAAPRPQLTINPGMTHTTPGFATSMPTALAFLTQHLRGLQV